MEYSSTSGKGVPPSKGKLVYHMTALSNLPSIAENGLMSRKQLLAGRVGFCDLANQEILSKRDKRETPLSDYVPFHFFTKTPFDWAVCQSTPGGAESLCIIALQRRYYKRLGMKVIPSHPINTEVPAEMYDYIEGYYKIDWATIDDKEHRDYRNHTIKMKCMAECLVPGPVPASLFFRIYVHSEAAKEGLRSQIHDTRFMEIVNVAPMMFP